MYLTHAADPIPTVSLVAGAGEPLHSVSAQSILTAVVSPLTAFIHCMETGHKVMLLHRTTETRLPAALVGGVVVGDSVVGDSVVGTAVVGDSVVDASVVGDAVGTVEIIGGHTFFSTTVKPLNANTFGTSKNVLIREVFSFQG